MSTGDMFVRLVLSMLLGGLVGLERERLERAAGLRTHALVAMGSCLIMLVSAFGFADAVTADHTVILDPSRVAAQVVSGIGFLGAGTIIFRKNSVSGLNTAASIWVVAGLGLAVGGGLYSAACAATVLMLVVQVGIRPIEGRLFAHKRPYSVSVELKGAWSIAVIEGAVRASGLHVRLPRVRPGEKMDRLDLEIGPALSGDLHRLLERLRTLAGVRSITCDRWLLRSLRPSDDSAGEETEGEAVVTQQ
jgi:putative Mg2+ transporter-C (MgtC) family protein